ncbi:MAG: alpha/beta hydrolase [Acidobacteriota bacterium]|nr:alpha/beta hydrolase [Acidobacteriota bacterium]
MARTKRLFRSFFRLFLPVVVLLVVGILAASVWFVHTSSNPPKTAYLLTPEKYGRLSTRGAKVTDEKWSNRDSTEARGWLLRGSVGAPAIILLHRYGADRSHALNLGVKLNEVTNFTILMPDMRGHGENPPVKMTTFGGHESEDVLSALDFLRSLKTDDKNSLVGKNIGVYGVEMGALAALSAASKDESVKAMVLDSAPLTSDDVLASVIDKRFPFASSVTSKMAQLGTYPYYYSGGYNHESLCGVAAFVTNRQILLLAGVDAPQYQNSTLKLQGCFPNQSEIETNTSLAPSGYSMTNASLEQSEAYDQRVIDFFKRTLNAQP